MYIIKANVYRLYLLSVKTINSNWKAISSTLKMSVKNNSTTLTYTSINVPTEQQVDANHP
jgi:hypothetical protein